MKYLLALIAAIALSAAVAGAIPPEKGEHAVLKAVVHINFDDVERQQHGLGNIDNILNEAPEAKLEVVCHGKGISLVDGRKTTHVEQVLALIKRGVRFVACENTMKKERIENGQLVADVTTVPSGAVEVLLKQQEGYGYFRP